MLLLGTYRETELEPGHSLLELVGDVRREGLLKRLDLGGLAEPEVAELVAALGVNGAEPAFVRALHGETEGNPFFIEEVVRHLRESERELHADISLTEAGVPDGVREVTARRLRRLDPESRQALQFAAVIGREFDYDVLEAVAPIHDDALIAALDDGVDARVLRETGRVGRYAFTHALVRATLYDGLSRLRRARLHGRVGEAIVRLRGSDLDPYLPQLAFHFAQAAPVEQPDRAIDYALAAARRADRLLAWEEAAQHYRAALRARDLTGAREDPVRAELLLAQGTSEDRAGLEDAARATFQDAAATARMLGDAALLGRAALGFAGQWSVLGRVDEERLAVLEEALAALGEEDSPLRARLLARLALELYYSGDPEPPPGAVRAGGRARAAARGPADAGRVPRRSALRAVAAGDGRRAARGRRRAAPGGRADRRCRARARGRGLDGRRPARARRRRGRRRPDRGRVQARGRSCSDRCGCGGRCSCAARAHR